MLWDGFFPFVLVVAAFVLAVKALREARRLRREFAGLATRFATFERRLVPLGEPVERAAAPVAAAPAPLVADELVAEELPVDEPVEAPVEVAAVVEPPVSAPPVPPARGWEQILVENWLVWLGGATIALGGAFLVKLSIDYGLLTATARVCLGVVLGIALSVGAERLRRRELAAPAEDETEGKAAAMSYVPAALAAAGAATVFASLYAAYALYHLLPAGVAFALLAVTAGAAVAQSLRMGPLVAALGLVGAYTVPLLVASEAPHALPLFGYLAFVTAGALAVLRHRAWWWLAWLSLAGAMLWVPAWLAAASRPETPVVAGYLLVVFALFVVLRRGVERVGFLAGIAESEMVRAVTRAALWAIALGLLIVAHADGFGATSVAAALAAMLGMVALAYRDSALDDVIAAAGALALALLASWSLPPPAGDLSLQVFRLQPDHVADFITAASLFTLLLGVAPFFLLTRVARPGRWAALSAATPLAILVIGYWRLQRFELDVAWTLAALALAGIELAAAAAIAARRDAAGSDSKPGGELEIALAAYAIGVLGSTIFAATLALGDAWLTVALALHLPAIGWVNARLRVAALRPVAFAIAAAVLVRLLFNPYVLDYPLGETPIFNWLLYGYGVPAAAFIVATRQFGSDKDDALVWLLEGGSVLFALALLSLELVHAVYGRLTSEPLDDFTTGAALIALWMVFATALVALGERRRRPVLLWMGSLLLGAATLIEICWQPLMLLFGTEVGSLAIFDALLFADAVPAAVYALVAWRSPARPLLCTTARVLAALFAFAWITLEIRHIFQGRVELFANSGEGEWYAYSAAWLVFAGAALGLGLLRRSRWLRQAGLLGIGLVVAKVFLSDMAALSGVLRALSFLGLGGALVGLGYAYRRFRPLQAQPGS